MANLDQRGLLLVIANSVSAHVREDDAPQGLGLDELVDTRRHVDDAGPVVDDSGGNELLLVNEGCGLQSGLELLGEVGGKRAANNDGAVIRIQVPVAEVRDRRVRGPDLNDLMSIQGDVI